MPGRTEEDVVGRVGGQPSQGRWDHGARMTAEDVLVVDVSGAAGISGDGVRWMPEPVVIVRQRDDARSPFCPDLTAPGEGVDGKVHQRPDRMGPVVRIGEVAKFKVASYCLGQKRSRA